MGQSRRAGQQSIVNRRWPTNKSTECLIRGGIGTSKSSHMKDTYMS